MQRLEYDYTYESKWIDYLVQQSINEATLDRYVGECLVFSEGSNVYDKLVAINEAISDKITSAWDKIMDFLRRMWGKFTETLNSILAKDTTYLEKYKDIILSKPIKAFAQVSMFDLTAGEKNIANIPVPIIDSGIMDSIPVKTGETDETKSALDAMRTRIVSAWQSGKPNQNPEGKEWQQWLVDFFKGALGGEKNYNADALDIRGMYQFCMNKSKLLSTLDKDRKNIETSSKEFADEAKKYATDSAGPNAGGKDLPFNPQTAKNAKAIVTDNGTKMVKDGVIDNGKFYFKASNGEWKTDSNAVTDENQIKNFQKNAVTGGNDNSKPATSTGDAKPNANSVKEEAAYYAKQAQQVGIQDADLKKADTYIDKKNNTINKGIVQRVKEAASKLGKKIADFVAGETVYSAVYDTYFNEVDFSKGDTGNSGSTSSGNAGTTAAAVAQKNSVANQNRGAGEAVKAGTKYTQEQISNKATNWITACKDVLTAKMTATEYIHKEYMTIIKTHVAYYVGREKIEDNRNAPAAQNRDNNPQGNANTQNQQTQGTPENQGTATGGGQ